MKAYAMFDPDFQDLIHITSDKKGSKFNMFSNALAATSSYIVKAEFSNESSSLLVIIWNTSSSSLTGSVKEK